MVPSIKNESISRSSADPQTSKKASDPIVDAALHDNAKNEFLSLAKNLFLGGAAAGGAVRGGQGLINMMRRNVNPPQSAYAPLDFSVPFSQKRPEEEQESDILPFGKAANAFTDAFVGPNATTMTDLPYSFAGAGLALGGGMYGGYKAIDSIMQARRKGELATEEQDAEDEYNKSLYSLVTPKSGSIDEKLERLYQQKEATTFTNLALAGWPAIALPAGAIAYQAANARRKSKLMAKALKQRQRAQLEQAPVFAYTQDVGGRGEMPPAV